MINMTRAVFRFGGPRTSRVINRNYRCMCVSREKNHVLHDSWSFKTDQWFISLVATGGAHEFPKRERRKIANEKEICWTMMGWKRGSQKGPRFALTTYFLPSKNGGPSTDRPLSGRYLFVALRNKLPRLFACGETRPPSFNRREGDYRRWDDFQYCDTIESINTLYFYGFFFHLYYMLNKYFLKNLKKQIFLFLTLFPRVINGIYCSAPFIWNIVRINE